MGRIHHVLFHDFIGRNQLETLCNRLVTADRFEDRILGYKSVAGNKIECVMDPRDVTCNTCQHVWRNIK